MLRPHELTQLKALPLFSEMKEESFASLLDAALLQQFPTGVVLLREGDHADFLHVLIEGMLSNHRAGRRRVGHPPGQPGLDLHPRRSCQRPALSELRPHLGSIPVSADSGATRPRHIRSGRRLRAHRGAGTAFAYRSSIKKLKGYMARSSVERLANWILTEAHRDTSQGNIVIPFDRGTLASHIGTTRESLPQPGAVDRAWRAESAAARSLSTARISSRPSRARSVLLTIRRLELILFICPYAARRFQGSRKIGKGHPIHPLPDEIVVAIKNKLGTNFHAFERTDEQSHQRAADLVKRAAAKDISGPAKAFGGIADGCVSCHRQFRASLRSLSD